MLTADLVDSPVVRPESSWQPLARPEIRDFLWIVAAGLVLFGINVDFQLHGDPAMYADYVLQSKFDQLTIHIGYYAVAWAFQHTVGAALDLPIERSLACLNVVAGALALGFMYLLARRFLRARADALLCVLILAVSGRVLTNATTAEIYMLQTCVVMAAFLMFVQGRLVVAGLLAGAGLLVSALSIFAYLFFPVYDYQRAGRLRWRALLVFGAAVLAVYVPYLLVFWRELFWGHRGLLNVNGGVPFQPMAMLVNVPLFQFKHYTVLLLLLIPALWAVRRERRLLWLTLAVVLPHLYVVSKLTSEDNVFLLNTDLFIACWLVLGWRALARFRWGRVVAPTLLAAHVALFVADGQLFGFRPHLGYAAEMRRIARQYLVGRDATMVTDWDTSMVLTFLGRPSIISTIERDPLWRQMYDVTAVRRMDPARLDAPTIYLLESWRPGELSGLLRSRSSQERVRRESTVVARAARLGLQCSLLEQTTFPLYRCVRRATPGGAGAHS